MRQSTMALASGRDHDRRPRPPTSPTLSSTIYSPLVPGARRPTSLATFRSAASTDTECRRSETRRRRTAPSATAQKGRSSSALDTQALCSALVPALSSESRAPNLHEQRRPPPAGRRHENRRLEVFGRRHHGSLGLRTIWADHASASPRTPETSARGRAAALCGALGDRRIRPAEWKTAHRRHFCLHKIGVICEPFACVRQTSASGTEAAATRTASAPDTRASTKAGVGRVIVSDALIATSTTRPGGLDSSPRRFGHGQPAALRTGAATYVTGIEMIGSSGTMSARRRATARTYPRNSPRSAEPRPCSSENRPCFARAQLRATNLVCRFASLTMADRAVSVRCWPWWSRHRVRRWRG